MFYSFARMNRKIIVSTQFSIIHLKIKNIIALVLYNAWWAIGSTNIYLLSEFIPWNVCKKVSNFKTIIYYTRIVWHFSSFWTYNSDKVVEVNGSCKTLLVRHFYPALTTREGHCLDFYVIKETAFDFFPYIEGR